MKYSIGLIGLIGVSVVISLKSNKSEKWFIFNLLLISGGEATLV